jgi:hypothetical protein
MALQEVLTRFGFQFDQGKITAIERGVRRTERNLNQAAHSSAVFQERMRTAWGWARNLLIAAGGTAIVRSLTTGYAQSADAIAKFATASGVATDVYQGLQHAVQIGGTDTANLNKAIQQLGKRSKEAAEGNKLYRDSFEQLGVSVKGADGKLKSADQLFVEMADGFVNLEDKGKRTGLAMELLGRTGATLLPTFLEGSEGIRKLITEAKQLGIVLSKRELKAAEKFQDSMLRLKTVFKGLRNQISAKLLPAITRNIERFRKWWMEGNNAERVMKVLKIAAISLGTVLTTLAVRFAVDKLKTYYAWVKKATLALWGMGRAALWAGAKTAIITASVVLIAAAIEDLHGFMTGKDSITGRLIGEDTTAARTLRGFLRDVKSALVEIWKSFGPIFKELWLALKPILREIWIALKPLLPYVKILLVKALHIAGFLVVAILTTVRVLIQVIGKLARIIRQSVGTALEFIKFLVADINKGLDAIDTLISDIGKGIKSAWGTALEFVDFLLADIEKGFKAIGTVAEKFGKILLTMVKLPIDLLKRGIGWIIDKINWALNQVSKVKKALGIDQGPGLGAVTRKAFGFGEEPGFRGKPPEVVGLPGTRLAAALAGMPVGGGQTINTTVGPTAVNVSVTTNDPAVIKETVFSGIRKVIQDTINSASRDIKRPPSGQR